MSTALSIFNAGSTELRHVGLCLRRTLAARTNRRVSVHRELDCLFVRGCFARGAPNDCLAQMGHVSGPPETQVHGPVPLFAVRRNASALCDVLYAEIGIVGPRVRVHVRSPLRVRGVRGGWLPDQEPFAVFQNGQYRVEASCTIHHEGIYHLAKERAELRGHGDRFEGSPSSLLCDVSQVVIVGQEGSGVGIRGEIMWQTSSLADNVDDFSTGALLFHTTAQVRDVQ